MSINWTPLINGISGSLAFTGDAGYTRINGYNTFSEIAKTPIAIAYPINEKDICTIVNFVRDNGITFTTRAGGGSFVGASNTDGLLINLEGYTGISVSSGGTRVTMKAGSKMGDIYYALYASGYTLSLPTEDAGNNVVGLGLALGGGHTSKTGQYGLLSQRIRGARVVLYDGSVVECDNYKNSDLLWALKGGGGGAFGIVSEITFEPTPYQRHGVVSARFRTDGLTYAYHSWLEFLKVKGITISTSATFLWPGGTRVKIYGEGGTGFDFSINIGLSGTTTEAKNYLETCGVLPTGITYTFTSTNTPSNPPVALTSTTRYGNDQIFNFGFIAGESFESETVDVILRKTREFCLGICGGGTYSGLSGTYTQPFSIILNGYRPATTNDKTNSNSFPYLDGLHSFQFRMRMSDYTGTNDRRPTVKQFMTDFFHDVGSASGYKGYCNYPLIGLTSAGETGYGKIYWGNNLLPLQQVKKAYDPNNLFDEPHSVPPLS